MLKGDKICRVFKKDRGSTIVEYPFTTRSVILIQGDEYKVSSFLKKVFIEGYPKRDLGCSDSKLAITKVKKVEGSELVRFAQLSRYEGEGRKQHEIVQEYFFEHDENFVCFELPVWDHERQGFIDLVRFKDGKIQICDFKPDAAKEKKAATQLLRYVKMFCDLTKWPTKDVEAFYFDNKNCYKLIF